MYKVKFVAYNGMQLELEDVPVERDEAQALVRRFNAQARAKGMAVEKCDHNCWEHNDENSAMIGDDQGYLIVKRVKVRR